MAPPPPHIALYGNVRCPGRGQRHDIVWFHDIAPRGRDNVAGRTIARLALTITRVGTIPRPAHDIVGKRAILSRGPAISLAGDDIAPRARYRAHARYRQCTPRYPVPPHDIAPRAHDNAGRHDTTPRSQYRAARDMANTHDIAASRAISARGHDIGALPRYRELTSILLTGLQNRGISRYRAPPVNIAQTDDW